MSAETSPERVYVPTSVVVIDGPILEGDYSIQVVSYAGAPAMEFLDEEGTVIAVPVSQISYLVTEKTNSDEPEVI